MRKNLLIVKQLAIDWQTFIVIFLFMGFLFQVHRRDMMNINDENAKPYFSCYDITLKFDKPI